MYTCTFRCFRILLCFVSDKFVICTFVHVGLLTLAGKVSVSGQVITSLRTKMGKKLTNLKTRSSVSVSFSCTKGFFFFEK